MKKKLRHGEIKHQDLDFKISFLSSKGIFFDTDHKELSMWQGEKETKWIEKKILEPSYFCCESLRDLYFWKFETQIFVKTTFVFSRVTQQRKLFSLRFAPVQCVGLSAILSVMIWVPVWFEIPPFAHEWAKIPRFLSIPQMSCIYQINFVACCGNGHLPILW